MIDVRRQPADDTGTAVIRVVGDVDLATSPMLMQTINDALDDDARHVHVDLSAVDFLDSTGLRVLVDGHRRAAQRDGRLYVTGATEIVARVLAITGLTEALSPPESAT